jgi:predicted phosphodiesterase
MTVADDIADLSAHRTTADLESKVATARRERDVARQALRNAETDNASMRKLLNMSTRIEGLSPTPPKWLTPARPRRAHTATICTILSDCHFDEVVRPEEVGGVNAYNREIATLRLQTYFENVVKLARDYLSGVDYAGVVLMLGGDLFSGDIHEELAQTNEDTILGSILYWVELLAAGITMLAEEFGQVHVPVVVGNHGRRTRKPRMKLRARDNFDWFLDIPEQADCPFQVYDTRFLLTHGDQFKGGNGIAGIWSPISRGHAKKSQRNAVAGQPYDVMVMGHFHTLTWGNGFIVNGANKGTDEYSWIGNMGHEVPQQAMFLVTPQHGITFTAPVLVSNRKAEGW